VCSALRVRWSAREIIIKHAGHNLHLDGWEEFNQLMRREMEVTLRRGREEKGLEKRGCT
jgi:cardiolipin-specific phospholipase